VAKTLRFAPGTILVMDRGSGDYAWFATLILQEVFCVTRLKANAVYTVLGTRDVPAHRHIVRDELIQLTGRGAPRSAPIRSAGWRWRIRRPGRPGCS
jgi:putative transposase